MKIGFIRTKQQASHLILKAMPRGGSHPTHKYLRREGEPGHWHYVYKDDEDANTVETNHAMSGTSEGGNKLPPAEEESMSSGSGGSGAPQASSAGQAKLMLSASVLRDAKPEDLQSPQVILWAATTESGLTSARQTGKFVGNHTSGGVHLSGNRLAAVSLARSQPILMAVKVETAGLKPLPPAKTIEESLFPEDPAGSMILYMGPVNSNAIIGVVHPGDPLWPKGDDDDEMSDVQDKLNESSE